MAFHSSPGTTANEYLLTTTTMQNKTKTKEKQKGDPE